MNKLIGFIGQGFIGKAYADDFEARGFKVVRYSQEPEYIANKEKIADCDIVFIAVPTPTTREGFDDRILISVMPVVGKGKVAVIKSTITPATVDKLEKLYPDIFIIHSPEFLRAATATEDAKHPHRNIVGVTEKSKPFAEEVLSVLPQAPYNKIVDAKTAALIKYGGNVFRYFKILFVNSLYELCQAEGVDYEKVREALVADPFIEESFTQAVHEGGRGVGRHCLIKDFAAYRALLQETSHDPKLIDFLLSAENYNKELLENSGKDIDILKGVYS
ncbi:MAG: hypothetical protein WC817_04610 [Patescibacteria group bacterium]|jgi:UDPglucose 6-dehydrogenase